MDRNQLSGVIPTQLAALTALDDLRLADNQLVSTIPTQFISLQLQRIYLTGNTITGCLPYWLGPGFVQYGDMARLNLPDCVGTEPTTPETPLPTYTLTVTAGAGGEVTPSGATYDEAVEVVLTASWNDATHTFAGWSGDCSGSATTCTLEMYNDFTVAATFTELPATRCAAPEDADCLRAVYLGAPDDYAQVQDIPVELLLTPSVDGRYVVERGQQVTVVTAAPLPAGWTRFYPQQDPLGQPWAVSFLQLIPPVGTTYTFTPSTDPAAADLISFDLHAARPHPSGRPGLKPILGDVIVTTVFEIPPSPLTLELTSSRELCTANTLTELSWTITGGKPPYTLTIDGETINAGADSHRVNCGPLMIDPLTEQLLPGQSKTFHASVTDSQASPATVTATASVGLAPPLASPTGIEVVSRPIQVSFTWNPKPAPPGVTVLPHMLRDLPQGLFLARYRLLGAASWIYELRQELRFPLAILLLEHGTREFQIAELRDPLEAETPDAMDWSEARRVAPFAPPEDVTATATHNTVTVTWTRQPYAHHALAVVTLDAREPYNGQSVEYVKETGVSGAASVTFEHLPPDAEFIATVTYGDNQKHSQPVRTAPEPEGYDYAAIPQGPQNLRATVSEDGTEITVTWDDPHPGNENLYHAGLSEEETGGRLDRDDSILPSQNTWTTTDSHAVGLVRPGREYRVWVVHDAIPYTVASILVTPTIRQASSPASRGTPAQPRSLPRFAPIWPISIGPAVDYVDDPYTDRGNGFHIGLDIGADDGPG